VARPSCQREDRPRSLGRATGPRGGRVPPLSEHEQRALEALEQALHKDDPDFAHRVRSENVLLDARRRRALAFVGFLVGLGLMLGFCFTTVVAMGVAGFLVMFFSLYVFWLNANRILVTKAHDPTQSEPTVPSWRPWQRRRG
jgi:hypothetical protein